MTTLNFIEYRVHTAAGAPIEPWTRCTWREFAEANRDDDDVVRVRAELEATGRSSMGGGAAPICTIRVVPEPTSPHLKRSLRTVAQPDAARRNGAAA